ncbi:hypothetical protein BDK51DRAFT_33026, partial [Blyttiomyces helicus]
MLAAHHSTGLSGSAALPPHNSSAGQLLKHRILSLPAIDAHAHPLWVNCTEKNLNNLNAIASEAEGEALKDAPWSLPGSKAVKEVAALYNVPAANLLQKRDSLGSATVVQKCLTASNLSGILLDDGFYNPNLTLPVDAHASLLPNATLPVRRILRIESVAEQILSETVHTASVAARFNHLVESLTKALDPPPANVVAFKSVAAYRS